MKLTKMVSRGLVGVLVIGGAIAYNSKQDQIFSLTDQLTDKGIEFKMNWLTSEKDSAEKADKIVDLETKIEDITNESLEKDKLIKELRATVAKTKIERDLAIADAQAKKWVIKGLEEKIHRLENQIADLENKKVELENKKAELENTVNDLQNQNSQLETENKENVDKANEEIDKANQEIDQANKEQEEIVQKLEESLDRLEEAQLEETVEDAEIAE